MSDRMFFRELMLRFDIGSSKFRAKVALKQYKQSLIYQYCAVRMVLCKIC